MKTGDQKWSAQEGFTRTMYISESRVTQRGMEAVRDRFRRLQWVDSTWEIEAVFDPFTETYRVKITGPEPLDINEDYVPELASRGIPAYTRIGITKGGLMFKGKEINMARVTKETPFFVIGQSDYNGNATGYATKQEAVDAASQFVTANQTQAQVAQMITVVKPKTNVDVEDLTTG